MEAETNYKRIFECAPALFLLLKPDAPHFTIIDASEAYLSATMTQRSEIIGKGLFQVFPDNPDDLTATGTSNLGNSLRTALETKKQHVMAVQKYDIPLPPEKGGGFEERHWNPKNTPVLDAQQKVIYLIHQVEDVTATVYLQRKMVSDARLAADELEQKSQLIRENQDRISLILNALLKYTTMDFSEKLAMSHQNDELDAIALGLNSLVDELENHMRLLTESNQELEYANKELDSFSYSVSHDLRAPLRAINGYSQVLMEDYGDKLDEEGKQTIGIVMKNASKMGALIDDLLAFSRIGKQNLTKVLLNMNQIVEGILQEYTGPLQKNNKVEVKVKLLDRVEGDNSMIRQVMTNLVSNAVKYSGKKDKPVVEIGSYIKEDRLVYYVKDNGVGFDMTYYNKLFGVFQRLHGSSEFEGTGVGLALVQRIIRKHQGEVWAEASVNQGATFYFSLPFTYASTANDPSPIPNN